MSREKSCAFFLLFALTLAVTSDAWAQRRRKSKPAAATPAGESQSSSTGAKSVSESSPDLDRAEKFYQRGDYYMASIEFNNPESLNCYGRRFEMAVARQALRASVPLSGRHDRYDRYRLAGTFTLNVNLEPQ